MLHWAWQGVSRFALKRAMTLASTNPQQMLRAETALDHWHCCSQDVKMTHNPCTQCKSVNLAADLMSCTLEKTKKSWLWNAMLGMAGVVRVCFEASNAPCIHKSASDGWPIWPKKLTVQVSALQLAWHFCWFSQVWHLHAWRHQGH